MPVAVVYGLIPSFALIGYTSELSFDRGIVVCNTPEDIVAKLLESCRDELSESDCLDIESIQHAVKIETDSSNEGVGEGMNVIHSFIAALRIVKPVLAHPQYIFSYHPDIDTYFLRVKSPMDSCYSITANTEMHKFSLSLVPAVRTIWRNIPTIVQNDNRVWIAQWLSEGAYIEKYHEFRILFFAMALESLFSKREFQLTVHLADRAAKFLMVSQQDREKLRGRVRDAYDIRSSIVHGLRQHLSYWQLRFAEILLREAVRQSLYKIAKDTSLITTFDGPEVAYDSYFAGL